MKNKSDATPAKKPATRPWDKKHDESKSWRPDFLRLSKKRPGFHYRWVRKDKADLWLMRGYVVTDPASAGADAIGTLDGKPLGKYVQRAELVLMEIPVEMFQKNQKAMDQRIKESQKARKAEVRKELADVNRQLEEAGAEPTTLIDETVGIQ